MNPLAEWHDCGVQEGQLHQWGCDMERCPFCGRQLITCGCCYNRLRIRDRRYTGKTDFLPQRVYDKGMSARSRIRWQAMLTKKGRVPWIQYPVICARCGELWPDTFSVADAEWGHYIPLTKQDSILCEPCYRHIKALIDKDCGVSEGR